MTEEINAPSHPINLAVFRIAVFFSLLLTLDGSPAVLYSRLPTEYLLLPEGLPRILPVFYLNPLWVGTAKVVLTVCCLTGMVGLFSRSSALIVTLLSIYVLGVPNLFGKVNHYHFLVWFTALLAAGRSGDALSLDAVIRAWRHAAQRLYEIPGPSAAYGAPLRFVWLTIGLIYLFPGFWKILSGPWISSDTIRFMLYRQWVRTPELSGWRIDLLPDTILTLMAAGVVLFEIGFVFLIAFRRTRTFAAWAGLAFHNANAFTLGIPFAALQFAYVAFFDISSWCRWVGAKLFPLQGILLYDGNCLLCRRVIGMLRVFDVFDRLTYINFLDEEQVKLIPSGKGERQSWARDMHMLVGRRAYKGYDAYREMARRIPFLWPVVPFLYLRPVKRIGNRIYRSVADSRVCRVVSESAKASTRSDKLIQPVKNRIPRTVAWTGNLVLLGAAVAGLLRAEMAWPFACFPIFAYNVEEEDRFISLYSSEQDGSETPIDLSVIRQEFRPERFRMLLLRIAAIGIETGEALPFQKFWATAAELDPRLRSVHTVRFYRVMLRVRPEEKHKNPVVRSLILEFPTVPGQP